MNKSNINELPAGTEADINSTAQNQQVSQPNANTNVGSSLWSEKYELHIGKAYNMETQMPDAKFKIIVSREQFQVIEQFADIEQDEELNKTYIINKCRFKVYPHFGAV